MQFRGAVGMAYRAVKEETSCSVPSPPFRAALGNKSWVSPACEVGEHLASWGFFLCQPSQLGYHLALGGAGLEVGGHSVI